MITSLVSALDARMAKIEAWKADKDQHTARCDEGALENQCEVGVAKGPEEARGSCLRCCF